MNELPNLRDYEVSPITGFLPESLPLERLSDDYYTPWESLVNVLPSLLLTKKIRPYVDKLPQLSIDKLGSDKRELRRAYSILSFLSHAYVWGTDTPSEVLPKQLAEPLLKLSEILELPPLATYSGLILWNFKPIFNESFNVSKPSNWDLNELTTINTYTGSIDESWFYLVSVYFEYKGAPCLVEGLKIMKLIKENSSGDKNTEEIIKSLQHLAEHIDELGTILMKMEEMCDPHAFYYRIRPYLAGWKNMAEAGLPNGVLYGDETEHRSYSGGSNAQSSLIQALDIILGVEHYPTGSKPAPSDKENDKSLSVKSGQNNFMNEMREYMPGPHKRFLEHLAKVSNIREFVLNNSSNKELVLSYDAAIAMLKSFRDKHIQIVTRYIILQAKLYKKAGSTNALRSGLSKTHEEKEQKGTGGTSLIPFLKQCRDETGELAASKWGKRILSYGLLNNRSSEITDDEGKVNANKRQKLGLAGSWNDNEEQTTAHW